MRAAVAGGVDWVQLREKDLDGRPLFELAQKLIEVMQRENPEARCIVNRRVDVALAAGLSGVHLGGDAMSVADARRLLPRGALVGVSTHAPGEIGRAGAQPAQAPAADAGTVGGVPGTGGAGTVGVAQPGEDARTVGAAQPDEDARPDYIHLAPIWKPKSKIDEREPLGPAALAEAAAAGIPVFAQGGVDAGRAGECLAAGAVGVAVSGAILAAEAPERAAAELRRALDDA